MKWTFQREAGWMLWLGLIPAIGILGALAWPVLRRAFE